MGEDSSTLIFESRGNECCEPLLSISIPTYLRPDLLKTALQSAAEQNTNVEYEIIVVDNGQVEEGAIDDVLNACKNITNKTIRLFRNKKNVGMVGNWNRCIELARGKYVSILNDDDYLMPHFIESVVPHLNDARMVIAKSRMFVIGGDLPKGDYVQNLSFSHVRFCDLFLGNPIFGTLGMVMLRDAALNLGGYHSDYYPSFDYEFTCSYCMKYGGVYLNAELAGYGWGVNESRKIETLSSFLLADEKIRDLMLQTIDSGIRRGIGRNVAVYLQMRSAVLEMPRFNPEFNPDEFLMLRSLRKLPANILKRGWVLIRFLTKLLYGHRVTSIHLRHT